MVLRVEMPEGYGLSESSAYDWDRVLVGQLDYWWDSPTWTQSMGSNDKS